MIERGAPAGAVSTPTVPLTSTVRRAAASARNRSAWPATAAAPTSGTTPAPVSARSTTSGSRTAIKASKSPSREAARNASTTVRCRLTSVSGTGAACTRRRARLASWRVASGDRSTIGAISSNGTANMSWSTNASRSAGGSLSSTTSRARPTASASSAWCSGSTRSSRSTIGSGVRSGERILPARPPRAQDVQAHPGHHGRQPAAEVLDVGRVGPAQPQPRLLQRVVGLAQRAEHPVADRAQVAAVLLEALGELVRHGCHVPPSAGVNASTRRTPPM